MSSKLPFPAHGDTLAVVKIGPAYEGKGEARHVVGSVLTALLLFDNCAQVPITIMGLDNSKLPAPELVTERNMQMHFLIAKFQNLVISFSGGDFGSIRYKGTAAGVEFLNLNPPPAQTNTTPTK